MKTIYQITIGDVILLQETKSGNHLKSKWIPFFIAKKGLEKLIGKVFERLGTQTIDELEEKIERVLSYRHLQKLEALWKALNIEMELKPEINCSLNSTDNESILLSGIIAKIKEVSGIDIEELDDIERFRKHIEFKNDKHIEMYPEPKEINPEETDYVDIIQGYFRYMSESYNESMRFLAFISMKKTADKIVLKNSING